ncbi:hypothetical protein CYMTET_31139 [Cymbomonas tetramitiformis]|uniref:Arp2/3 complex 34 kDa subunit n=1 Tax=Cymbomonas tetramitiformis TaxID=36881 RepID=A0AAE0KTG1_9CHLO|nr:hypothetical protein CYMTET_31139 [Cymbomonas tetramitiformis]
MASSENTVIKSTVDTRAKRCESPDTVMQNQSISINLVEFDDVLYRIQADVKAPTKLVLSMALPPQPGQTVTIPAGAQQAISAAYGPVAQILSSTEEGYHISVEFSLDMIPHHSETVREEMINKIASFRSYIMGAPLRSQLERLASGSCIEGPAFAVPHRINEAYFIKPENDAVTVVFPMRFKDPNDATMACTFLYEFNEARKGPSLSQAPSCSYSKAHPMELNGMAPVLAHAANGGYVSFVLNKRHVTVEEAFSEGLEAAGRGQ